MRRRIRADSEISEIGHSISRFSVDGTRNAGQRQIRQLREAFRRIPKPTGSEDGGAGGGRGTIADRGTLSASRAPASCHRRVRLQDSERAILLSFAGEEFLSSTRQAPAVAVLFLDPRGGCYPRSRDRRYKQKSRNPLRNRGDASRRFFSVRFVTLSLS